jgi:hypothetical protein
LFSFLFFVFAFVCSLMGARIVFLRIWMKIQS